MHAKSRSRRKSRFREDNSMGRMVTTLIIVLGLAAMSACKRDPAPQPTAATTLSATQQAAIAGALFSSKAADVDALLESLANIQPADLRSIIYTITPAGAMSVEGVAFVQSTSLFKLVLDRLLVYQGTHDAQAVASAYEGVDQIFAGVMLSSQNNGLDDIHNVGMARTMRAMVLEQYLPVAADAEKQSIKVRIAALTRLARKGADRTGPVP